MLHPYFFWRSHTYQQCMLLFGISSFCTSTVLPGPMHSRLILAFKPLIPVSTHFVLSSFASSLSILCIPPFFGIFLYLLLLLSPLTLSRFFNGILEVFEQATLQHYTLSHLILWVLLYPRTNLNSSSSFRIPGFSAL